jgi:hypothetical protein
MVDPPFMGMSGLAKTVNHSNVLNSVLGHQFTEVLENLLSTDLDAKKEWDATFKLKNDPRITKIGGFYVGQAWMSYLNYSMY